MPILNQEETTRYSRHLLLPEIGLKGQERLKAASILIVGAGGLGCPAAIYLAAAGIGRIGIVEFDLIDSTNLQRQILYSEDAIGERKLTTAAKRLRQLNSHITIETHDTRLDADNAPVIIGGYDLVIDGSDNFSTRYLINDICVRLKKPLVHGSIYRFEGQVSVFNSKNGACLRCLYPSPPPADQAPNCAEAGVLGVLPGIIGTIQATEAIKLILNLGQSLSERLLVFDALAMQFQNFTFKKNAFCPACGSSPKSIPSINLANCDLSLNKTKIIEEIVALDFLKLRTSNQKHILLDVRSETEVSICKIAGSVHIPLNSLEEKSSDLDRSLPIIIYCKSGSRSATACFILKQRGFSDVRNLSGGIIKWIDEIDPTLSRY